jgi:peptidyl-prolyl cis-trans isomerase D
MESLLMMRQMRENTKWIMLITALAFVGLMIFQWGMDLSGRSATDTTGGDIGRVNGEVIAYQDFYTAYRSLYDQQQQQMPGQPITAALDRQIENAAWEQVIMQKLIEQELRKRGLAASDDEIREAARSIPPQEIMMNEQFQTNGQFDLTKYHEFLASPSLPPEFLLDLERYYREAIPRQKLYFQTVAGTYISDNELWRMWRNQHDSVTVRFIAFDPESMVPETAISITDEEISAYYRAHRDDFTRPARAKVKYIVLDRTPVAADSAATLERARRLRAEIQGGADFAEVAKRESADSVSAQQGGKLTITKGSTVQPFDDAAWRQPVGQVGEPVLTQFGYHLIKVDKRQADSADVRHILVPIRLAPEREGVLLDQADSLDALSERLQLDEIGRQLGLTVREADMIPGLTMLPGVMGAQDGELWVFEDGQVGEVSRVFETPEAYYVLELVDRQEERTLTQEEALETIRAALRSEKKVQRAKETARAAVERIRSGQSLDEVAKAFNSEVKNPPAFTRGQFVDGLGRFNEAIGAAFGLKPGQTSGLVEADRRLFIIQVVNRKDANRAEWEAQKQNQRAQIAMALSQQRWEQYLQALRQSAKVEDNRDKVLRAPQANTAQS